MTTCHRMWVMAKMHRSAKYSRTAGRAFICLCCTGLQKIQCRHSRIVLILRNRLHAYRSLHPLMGPHRANFDSRFGLKVAFFRVHADSYAYYRQAGSVEQWDELFHLCGVFPFVRECRAGTHDLRRNALRRHHKRWDALMRRSRNGSVGASGAHSRWMTFRFLSALRPASLRVS